MYLHLYLHLVPTPRRSEDEEEQIDLDPEQLTIHAKRAGHVTSSRRRDAKTHCESQNADSQSLPSKQKLPERWKLSNSILPRNLVWMDTFLLPFVRTAKLRAKDFSMFKITSNSKRSREDRASDRNRSIRICKNLGCGSTGTATTTRKLEFLGVYLTSK